MANAPERGNCRRCGSNRKLRKDGTLPRHYPMNGGMDFRSTDARCPDHDECEHIICPGALRPPLRYIGYTRTYQVGRAQWGPQYAHALLAAYFALSAAGAQDGDDVSIQVSRANGVVYVRATAKEIDD